MNTANKATGPPGLLVGHMGRLPTLEIEDLPTRHRLPPGNGRLFYAVKYREDGTADVTLMPFEGVKIIVPGVDPWDGMEDDIRARYYAWCESGTVIIP